MNVIVSASKSNAVRQKQVYCFRWDRHYGRSAVSHLINLGQTSSPGISTPTVDQLLTGSHPQPPISQSPQSKELIVAYFKCRILQKSRGGLQALLAGCSQCSWSPTKSSAQSNDGPLSTPGLSLTLCAKNRVLPTANNSCTTPMRSGLDL